MWSCQELTTALRKEGVSFPSECRSENNRFQLPFEQFFIVEGSHPPWLKISSLILPPELVAKGVIHIRGRNAPSPPSSPHVCTAYCLRHIYLQEIVFWFVTHKSFTDLRPHFRFLGKHAMVSHITPHHAVLQQVRSSYRTPVDLIIDRVEGRTCELTHISFLSRPSQALFVFYKGRGAGPVSHILQSRTLMRAAAPCHPRYFLCQAPPPPPRMLADENELRMVQALHL